MKKSAGLLLYRMEKNGLEVFLVHPGGPYWKNKVAGAWSIPKGEFVDGEDALVAAKRELKEETGIVCEGPFIQLETVKQSSKILYAWAVKRDADASAITSNIFEIEWPPRSGKMAQFPEVDRAAWFTPSMTKEKIIPAQYAFIQQLIDKLEMSE